MTVLQSPLPVDYLLLDSFSPHFSPAVLFDGTITETALMETTPHAKNILLFFAICRDPAKVYKKYIGHEFKIIKINMLCFQRICK